MPISGLVITLADDAPAAAAALKSVRAHPAFTCETDTAPARGAARLPTVLDTPDKRADRAAWDWLNALPGVRHVDVVFIHFDTPREPTGPLSPLSPPETASCR